MKSDEIKTGKQLESFMLRQYDSGIYHKEYSDEYSFYALVKQGNIEEIKKYAVLHLENNAEGYGRLSEEPIRNLTYHFCILAAMLARSCTEGGMSREKAYSLSDLYIRACDRCRSVEQIQMLHEEMILDYTMRMKYIYRERVYSKYVSKALSIAECELFKRITVEEIAKRLKINRSHLSRLFKKEVGISLSEYIHKQKIETAKGMLQQISNSEIAAALGFSSQSHFIQVFKKYTGKTPLQYSSLQYKFHVTELINKEAT